MKKILLLACAVLGLNAAFAQEPTPNYRVEVRNMIYEGTEKTFIMVTISNASDKELKHKGYGFTAEYFSATDSKGNILKDSAWVSGLRRKKRDETPISVPAKGSTCVMYALDKLFMLETNDTITVVCGLSKSMQVKIDNPKQ